MPLETQMREIQILKELDHPHILKLFEYFIDEKRVMMVTEYCSGGELFDLIEEKTCFSE